MIAQLIGVVYSVNGNQLTLDVNGVGYEVFCSRNALSLLRIGERATVIIYTDVREDSIKLYGFEDELEKQVFLLLMQVKGVGAKTGSDIISRIDKRELLRFIGAGDLNKLQAVKGIGKKTAERIIVELKDRVAEYALEKHALFNLDVEIVRSEPAGEAIEALQSLGFTRRDAERAVQSVGSSQELFKLGSGEIVKQALRHI